jgi:hypothetical protein
MSGDLAYSGKADELAEAESVLLRPLLDALELPTEHMVLVPGNHDVDRDLIDWDLEEGLRVRLANRESVNDLMADPSRREKASERLKAWSEFHSAFYGDHHLEAIPPFGWSGCA